MRNRDLLGAASVPCGCWLSLFAFNLTLGGVCFDYALYSILGKDAPWWADVLVGMVTAQVTVPVAAICWIARLAGVEAPFYPA